MIKKMLKDLKEKKTVLKLDTKKIDKIFMKHRELMARLKDA